MGAPGAAPLSPLQNRASVSGYQNPVTDRDLSASQDDGGQPDPDAKNPAVSAGRRLRPWLLFVQQETDH